MKIKKIIAVILGLVVILSAGAAESRADSLVVEQGDYFVFGLFDGITDFAGANFSGNGFSVNASNVSLVSYFDAVFSTGILETGFGTFGDSSVSTGTIQIGDVSCPPTAPFPGATACGAAMKFVHTPITIPPNFTSGSFVGEAPFTMTGQLVIGRPGLPNLTLDIEGSGIVTATFFADPENFRQTGYNAAYFFAVPEPSTFVLLVFGLVAIGWIRWRGGKSSTSVPIPQINGAERAP